MKEAIGTRCLTAVAVTAVAVAKRLGRSFYRKFLPLKLALGAEQAQARAATAASIRASFDTPTRFGTDSAPAS